MREELTVVVKVHFWYCLVEMWSLNVVSVGEGRETALMPARKRGAVEKKQNQCLHPPNN